MMPVGKYFTSHVTNILMFFHTLEPILYISQLFAFADKMKQQKSPSVRFSSFVKYPKGHVLDVPDIRNNIVYISYSANIKKFSTICFSAISLIKKNVPSVNSDLMPSITRISINRVIKED